MTRRRFWSLRPSTAREVADAIFANFLLHWFPARMRVSSLAWLPTFWLGTVSGVLFVVLLLSGLPLMVFYIPSVEDAYRSVKDIEHVVSFGWWLRAVHRVAEQYVDEARTPFLRLDHQLVLVCLLGGFLSAWVDNVATLLIVAPVAFALAEPGPVAVEATATGTMPPAFQAGLALATGRPGERRWLPRCQAGNRRPSSFDSRLNG